MRKAQDITYDFTASAGSANASNSALAADRMTQVSVPLGTGASPPSVMVAAGEHAPAALAFASALALQAMMLGLPEARSKEDTHLFWKVSAP